MRKTEQLIPYNPAREARELRQDVAEAAGARSLQSSSIGEGGLTIKDGGNLTVKGGGGIRIEDGGTWRTEYPSGGPACQFGQIITPGATTMYGTLIQLDDNPDSERGGTDMLRLGVDEGTGRGFMVAGLTSAPMLSAAITADMIWLQTTEQGIGPANIYLDANNHLRKISSTRASKTDIVDIDGVTPEEVLALRPRLYRDRGAVERGEHAPVAAGFIAEEIRDTAPGLAPLLVHDNDGQLTYLAYERIPAYHHIVLRDHAQRLADAEARADAAEAALADLTARLTALETR